MNLLKGFVFSNFVPLKKFLRSALSFLGTNFYTPEVKFGFGWKRKKGNEKQKEDREKEIGKKMEIEIETNRQLLLFELDHKQ